MSDIANIWDICFDLEKDYDNNIVQDFVVRSMLEHLMSI